MHKLLTCIACAACAGFVLTAATPCFADENQDNLRAMDLTVSRLGDVEMSCGSLSQEALTMREIVNTTQDIQDESDMQSNGISAVGAVGSFVIGSVTGGIGLAAAGLLLDHNVGEKADKAETVQDIAQQRRSLMIGIYNAKGCFGPVEYALQDKAPQDFLNLATIETAAGKEDHASSDDKQEKPRYNN